MGTVVAGFGVETPGAECSEVLAAPDCVELLAMIENGTLPVAVSERSRSLGSYSCIFCSVVFWGSWFLFAVFSAVAVSPSLPVVFDPSLSLPFTIAVSGRL